MTAKKAQRKLERVRKHEIKKIKRGINKDIKLAIYFDYMNEVSYHNGEPEYNYILTRRAYYERLGYKIIEKPIGNSYEHRNVVYLIWGD
jgi:hypothetical protein